VLNLGLSEAIFRPIVELGRARAFMRGHCLRVFIYFIGLWDVGGNRERGAD
jgi:hypothetical protein